MYVNDEWLEAEIKQYRKKYRRASKKLAKFCILDKKAENLSNEKYFAFMQKQGISGHEVIKLNEERMDY